MTAEVLLDKFRYYTGEHNHSRYTELQSAYEDVLKRTKWWNTRIRKEDLLTLVSDTYRYKVDFSCFRGGSPTHVYIKSVNEDVWALLQESKFELFESNRPNVNGVYVDTNTRTYPTEFFLTGDPDYNFYVSPTPNLEVNLRFDGVMAIPELDRGVELIIHKDYHDSIVRLAAADFLELKPEISQQDLIKAEKLRNRAESGLRSLIDDMHPNRLDSLAWEADPLLY